jgi:hypothetical protein
MFITEFHCDIVELGCLGREGTLPFTQLWYANSLTAATVIWPFFSVSRFITEFHRDMADLGCLPPDAEPRATDYVPQMVETIQAIIGNGHAYESDGDVLFAVESIEGYGRLSGRSLVGF